MKGNKSKGFLYIIRLDEVAVPTWGKVGFSTNPEGRIYQAKTWWPNPKLIWKHPSEKNDEFEIIILMQSKLECNFFDPKIIAYCLQIEGHKSPDKWYPQFKCREVFECTDYEKLINNLNATLKF